MARYAAFLRGMNLGRRRVTNSELVAAFEALGLAGASAFLASGNVMFESGARSRAKLERTIAEGLEAELGYRVPTFVRSAKEIAAIAVRAPFPPKVVAATAGKLQVGLLAVEPPAGARRKALALATADDRLAIAGRELYWLPRVGVSTSELAFDALVAHLGEMTVRTQRTLVRLSAQMADG